MKAVLRKGDGGPDVLYVGEIQRPPLPQENHVLIKAYATALNRADTLQRQGKYPPPPGASDIIGLEVAGEIVEISPRIDKKYLHGDRHWKVGDRVMALLAGGGYAQYVVSHAATVLPIPADFSYEEAAAIPEVFLTSYQLLRYIGGIREGQTALLHAGASGIGTASIQLCNLFGARSIVTAGQKKKLEFCKQLGASAAINYKDQRFGDEVKEWCKQNNLKGVDIVTDPVGGSHFDDNIDVLAQDSWYIVYGVMSEQAAVQLHLHQLMLKRIKLHGTTLRARPIDYKYDLVEHFMREVFPALESKKVKPIIWKVYDWQQVAEAHQAMENNENIGKIVLKISH